MENQNKQTEYGHQIYYKTYDSIFLSGKCICELEGVYPGNILEQMHRSHHYYDLRKSEIEKLFNSKYFVKERLRFELLLCHIQIELEPQEICLHRFEITFK